MIGATEVKSISATPQSGRCRGIHQAPAIVSASHAPHESLSAGGFGLPTSQRQCTGLADCPLGPITIVAPRRANICSPAGGPPGQITTLGLMTSVVIVGSGFTGFTCARRLAKILRRQHAS